MPGTSLRRQPEAPAGSSLRTTSSQLQVNKERSSSRNMPAMVSPCWSARRVSNSQIPAKKAAAMMLDLMARGATGVQLTALGRDVQGDVAAGLKPDVALDLRGRGVLSLLPPPPPVSNVNVRPR